MVKLRRLDSSFLPSFRELLEEGFTLGPRISDLIDLCEGSLSVWAPEEIAVIHPKDLRTDIYSTGPWQSELEISKFLFSVSVKNDHSLLIGETDRFPNERHPLDNAMRFAWLSIKSSIPAYDRFLCVCSLDTSIGQQEWDTFEKEIKQYSSVVMITDRPTDLPLMPGEFIELNENRLADLLQTTRYIMVGVFDEMSMMLWERHPHRSEGHPEEISKRR